MAKVVPVVKRSPLNRTSPMKRGQPLKRTSEDRSATGRSKPPDPLASGVLLAMRAAWHRAAARAQCAAVGCGHATHVHGHHVVPLGDLKAAGVPEGFWYDLRNFLPLCHDPAPERHHDRHELWVARVPLAVVEAEAPQARVFATELGLSWRFDLEYPPPPEES